MKIVKITAAVCLFIALAALAFRFVYHITSVTYTMDWYNAAETKLGSDLPDKDPFGHPKTIILARSANGAVCYTAYYSADLSRILNSSRPAHVEVSYRVSYWLGKPYWIQQLDIQHLGNIAPPEYMGQTAGGECF